MAKNITSSRNTFRKVKTPKNSSSSMCRRATLRPREPLRQRNNGGGRYDLRPIPMLCYKSCLKKYKHGSDTVGLRPGDRTSKRVKFLLPAAYKRRQLSTNYSTEQSTVSSESVDSTQRVDVLVRKSNELPSLSSLRTTVHCTPTNDRPVDEVPLIVAASSEQRKNVIETTSTIQEMSDKDELTTEHKHSYGSPANENAHLLDYRSVDEAPLIESASPE